MNIYIGQAQKNKIHINYFDENEKQKKNCIITWNDAQEFPIFSEDKKRSQSKNHKRIGIHLELAGDQYDMNSLPYLKAYEGCSRNIKEEFIKPYETLNNIIKKNAWLRNYTQEEKRDEIYNNKIEKIDNIIKVDKNFINLIKNSILENEELISGSKRRFCLLINIIKNKSKVNEKGKRIYFYNIIWKIKELDLEEDSKEEMGALHKFKKIYLKNKIEDIDEYEELAQKLITELNKNDIEAQTKKLQTINMFLFGIITATARSKTTTKGQKRFKLSSEYIFEGIKICNLAFLIIYGIGEKYWRNIRNHFMQHGISPRIHKATGKVSNFALSFEKVLEVISFLQIMETFMDYLHLAGKEREFYRNCIQLSKTFIRQIPNYPNLLHPNEPNTLDFENHISWDYAEQIKIPYSSQQEGSTYFKSLYNIQVFGICEDAFSIQRNYLIKEEESIGKGANAVISFVHNYFRIYGLGETKLHGKLHVDYIPKLPIHSWFTYNEVDNLDDLIKVVETSTTGGFNKVQTIFDKNKNKVVHFYNWTEFLLKFFKPIPNILKYHHFILSKNNIGQVDIKEAIDRLLPERKWYLYEQVRQYIGNPQKQDEYCLMPDIPKPKQSTKK
ncbi:hypothetical protein RhiirA4_547753 [Rhizophagus irregularis]|uniref:Uncharacterized protein n=1 Tax=Rhizophagus irregularis TaxID=588596 RepID=A0A2I1H453_9GLOM|nr:hypothetical protein RhiirA4_547753 [Rhizophagus irregularis]